MPEDDWVEALRAGGHVELGPGVFETSEYVELNRSVTVTGQGSGFTSLWFASDGGEYGEQLALVAPESGRARFEFTGMDISQGSLAPSDLMAVWGDAHLVLTGVSLNFAFDEYDYYEDEWDVWMGSGLLLGAGASALVDSSEFHSNSSNGITALYAERLVVTNSSFHDNAWAGIYVMDTPLTASGNYFSMNDVGIEVYGTATRVLVANTFKEQITVDVYEATE